MLDGANSHGSAALKNYCAKVPAPEGGRIALSHAWLFVKCTGLFKVPMVVLKHCLSTGDAATSTFLGARLLFRMCKFPSPNVWVYQAGRFEVLTNHTLEHAQAI